MIPVYGCVRPQHSDTSPILCVCAFGLPYLTDDKLSADKGHAESVSPTSTSPAGPRKAGNPAQLKTLRAWWAPRRRGKVRGEVRSWGQHIPVRKFLPSLSLRLFTSKMRRGTAASEPERSRKSTSWAVQLAPSDIRAVFNVLFLPSANADPTWGSERPLLF